MRKYLIFWRDLAKESKAELKSKHNITTITYTFIKMVWEEINKKPKT